MLEEELDPRTPPEAFARRMAAHAAERGHTAADLARWLRGWHDRDDPWTSLHAVEHWISRAGA